MTTGRRLFSKEVLCFNTMPCRHVPVLVHFWFLGGPPGIAFSSGGGGLEYISYHIISYHIISYHIISYHIILYCTILYYTILYYITLYCIILCLVIIVCMSPLRAATPPAESDIAIVRNPGPHPGRHLRGRGTSKHYTIKWATTAIATASATAAAAATAKTLRRTQQTSQSPRALGVDATYGMVLDSCSIMPQRESSLGAPDASADPYELFWYDSGYWFKVFWASLV